MRLRPSVLFLLSPIVGVTLALANDARDTVAPNNTKMNERDRSDKNVTPIDQIKGSKNDVKVTQLVRKELMKHDKLSVDAQNVKIITLNGVVTLRGPVKSEEEKQTVSACAKGIAGAANVKDELEVAAN